jgi:hypothetical protein
MCTENKQVQPGLRELVQHSLQKHRQTEACSNVYVKNNKLLKFFHEIQFSRLFGYLLIRQLASQFSCMYQQANDYTWMKYILLISVSVPTSIFRLQINVFKLLHMNNLYCIFVCSYQLSVSA